MIIIQIIGVIFVMELTVVLGVPPPDSSPLLLQDSAFYLQTTVPLKAGFQKRMPKSQSKKGMRSAQKQG